MGIVNSPLRDRQSEEGGQILFKKRDIHLLLASVPRLVKGCTALKSINLEKCLISAMHQIVHIFTISLSEQVNLGINYTNFTAYYIIFNSLCAIINLFFN